MASLRTRDIELQPILDKSDLRVGWTENSAPSLDPMPADEASAFLAEDRQKAEEQANVRQLKRTAAQAELTTESPQLSALKKSAPNFEELKNTAKQGFGYLEKSVTSGLDMLFAFQILSGINKNINSDANAIKARLERDAAASAERTKIHIANARQSRKRIEEEVEETSQVPTRIISRDPYDQKN